MTDTYVSKARSYFGMGKDVKLDEFQTNMLLQAYTGITREELLQHIRSRGKGFTLDHFHQTLEEILKNVKNRLRPVAFEHVGKEHRESVVKEMGLEGKVDPGKMDVNELYNLMETYHVADGSVPGRAYKGKLYELKKMDKPSHKPHHN